MLGVLILGILLGFPHLSSQAQVPPSSDDYVLLNVQNASSLLFQFESEELSSHIIDETVINQQLTDKLGDEKNSQLPKSDKNKRKFKEVDQINEMLGVKLNVTDGKNKKIPSKELKFKKVETWNNQSVERTTTTNIITVDDTLHASSTTATVKINRPSPATTTANVNPGTTDNVNPTTTTHNVNNTNNEPDTATPGMEKRKEGLSFLTSIIIIFGSPFATILTMVCTAFVTQIFKLIFKLIYTVDCTLEFRLIFILIITLIFTVIFNLIFSNLVKWSISYDLTS